MALRASVNKYVAVIRSLLRLAGAIEDHRNI